MTVQALSGDATRSVVARAVAVALRGLCRAGVDGFLQNRGFDDAVEATVTFHGRAKGCLVIAIPRSLLPPLFGAIVPKVEGAETELLAALGELTRVTCGHVVRAMHESIYGFTVEPPRIGPAGKHRAGEIIMRVGDTWLAASLVDAQI